jgi:hypothetical protein
VGLNSAIFIELLASGGGVFKLPAQADNMRIAHKVLFSIDFSFYSPFYTSCKNISSNLLIKEFIKETLF